VGRYRELREGERCRTYSEHLWFGGVFPEVVFRGDVVGCEVSFNFFQSRVRGLAVLGGCRVSHNSNSQW